MANTPLFDMPADEFLAALDEFKTMDPSTDIDFLKREYNRVNSLTGNMDADVGEGRTGIAGNFLSKPEGSTGWDAVRGLRVEPRAGATGVAQGVEQALTATGRAAQGTMPADDMTLEAFGAASLGASPSLASAGRGISKVDESTVSMFGTRGTSGQGIDPDRLSSAVEMKRQGIDDGIIWEDTGLEWNPTLKDWEFEIDSSGLKMNDDAVRMIFTNEDGAVVGPRKGSEPTEQDAFARMYRSVDEVLADNPGDLIEVGESLGQIFDFEPLYQEYPFLKDAKLVLRDGFGASYDGENNIVTMGLETMRDTNSMAIDPENFKSILVHELQHGIQSVNSMAPGGSNNRWIMQNDPEVLALAQSGDVEAASALAFNKYRADQGEVQARASQMRREMTEGERRETPPSATYRMALVEQMRKYQVAPGQNMPTAKNLHQAPRDMVDPGDVYPGGNEEYFQQFAEGGLVAEVSNNAMADYFKAASGMMSEEEFTGKHKMSTRAFENKFEEQNNVDISGAESFTEITGTSKGDNMRKQMSFFNEGGMAAPRRDPVSGNEIPVGSSAENVRDDVPAMLSEGEYIVPADVVRFFGVNFFEQLRDKAKGGMQEMVADDRVGGNNPQQENMQVDPEMVQAVTQMAEGGLIDSGNINQLIDKVVESAKTNPELQGIFQKRGIMMAEGGLVTGDQPQGTFNAADWQNVGGSYGVGNAGGNGAAGGFEYVPYTGPNGNTMMVLHINGAPAQTIPEGFTSGKASAGINPNAGSGSYTAPTPQGNDKDQSMNAAQLYAQQGPGGQGVPMGEAGGALANFNSPLDGLDFTDSESVVEHFSGRLAPDALKAKLSPNLGLSMVSGAVNMGREARRIAETRAAAMAADAAGNEELATNLREMAQKAHDEYGLGGIMGLIPDEMMDGDRIYEGYVQKQQRLAEEGGIAGRSAATGTSANMNGMQAVSRDTPAGARPISGGVASASPLVRNNDGDGHRTVTDVGGVTYNQTSNSDDPNTYSSRTAVGSTAPTTSARPQARPMYKGGLVTRPKK